MVASSSSTFDYLPDDFRAAADANAERVAHLVGDFLVAAGMAAPDGAGRIQGCKLPAAFLLEVAGLVILDEWESLGITPHLPLRLPTCSAAELALLQRLERGPQEFISLERAFLWHMVNDVWCSCFAWGGKELLCAPCVISGVASDEMLDVIAEFLWRNRHSTTSEIQQ